MQRVQPGEQVAWLVYDAVHFGTVLESFNGDSILVDRGRTYLHCGIPIPDIDLVAVERLIQHPEPEPEPADDHHERPIVRGKKRKRRRMKKWGPKSQ